VNTVISREETAMAQRRYKKLRIGSFFGESIYDRVAPKDHLLRKLE
jgi:hypothetical protein